MPYGASGGLFSYHPRVCVCVCMDVRADVRADVPADRHAFVRTCMRVSTIILRVGYVCVDSRGT